MHDFIKDRLSSGFSNILYSPTEIALRDYVLLILNRYPYSFLLF